MHDPANPQQDELPDKSASAPATKLGKLLPIFGATVLWLVPYSLYLVVNWSKIDWKFVLCDPGKNLFGIVGAIIPYLLICAVMRVKSRLARILILLPPTVLIVIVMCISADIATGRQALHGDPHVQENSIPYPADYGGPDSQLLITKYLSVRDSDTQTRKDYRDEVARLVEAGRIWPNWMGYLGWYTSAISAAMGLLVVCLSAWLTLGNRFPGRFHVIGSTDDFKTLLGVPTILFSAWLAILAPISWKYVQLNPGLGVLSILWDFKTSAFIVLLSTHIALMIARSEAPDKLLRVIRIIVITIISIVTAILPHYPASLVPFVAVLLLVTFVAFVVAVCKK